MFVIRILTLQLLGSVSNMHADSVSEHVLQATREWESDATPI